MILLVLIILCLIVAFFLLKDIEKEEEDFQYIIDKNTNTLTILFSKAQRFKCTCSHEIQFNYSDYFEWLTRNMLNNFETTSFDPITNTKTTIVHTVNMHNYQHNLLDKTIKKHIKHFINDYKNSKL